MATSGTTSWNLTVDDIVDQAHRKVFGGDLNGYDSKSARQSLNMLLTDMQNRGVQLWKVELLTLDLDASDFLWCPKVNNILYFQSTYSNM